jgi:hypothetical protein
MLRDVFNSKQEEKLPRIAKGKELRIETEGC